MRMRYSCANAREKDAAGTKVEARCGNGPRNDIDCRQQPRAAVTAGGPRITFSMKNRNQKTISLWIAWHVIFSKVARRQYLLLACIILVPLA